MSTIIAATDFTAASASAVQYAADMASALGMRLTLFHAYPLPVPVSEIPVPVYSIEDLQRGAETQMAELEQQLYQRNNVSPVIETVVKMGNVLDELMEYCTDHHPYAIVMGSESMGVLERLLLGGKTTGAVRRSKWPVIVVPPSATFAQIRRIGLACDLKTVPQSIHVEEITRIVQHFKADFHVIHITQDDDLGTATHVRNTDSLQNLLQPLHPIYHYLHEQEVEEGLLDFAERKRLDLLIVIPKHHNLLSRLFYQSHSTKLVLSAQLPVMTVHE